MNLLKRHALRYRNRELWSVSEPRLFRTSMGGFIHILDDNNVNGYGQVSSDLTQEIRCELGYTIVEVLIGPI